jgi:hypothetical protein
MNAICTPGCRGLRALYVNTLGEACGMTGWQVHAFCLLPNHFYRVVETPPANLSAGMQGFLGPYTNRFNRRRNLRRTPSPSLSVYSVLSVGDQIPAPAAELHPPSSLKPRKSRAATLTETGTPASIESQACSVKKILGDHDSERRTTRPGLAEIFADRKPDGLHRFLCDFG